MDKQREQSSTSFKWMTRFFIQLSFHIHKNFHLSWNLIKICWIWTRFYYYLHLHTKINHICCEKWHECVCKNCKKLKCKVKVNQIWNNFLYNSACAYIWMISSTSKLNNNNNNKYSKVPHITCKVLIIDLYTTHTQIYSKFKFLQIIFIFFYRQPEKV